MSRRHKILDLLNDEHWQQFHELLSDRATTVDVAWEWLLSHDYTISRNAVWHYARRYRTRPLFAMRTDLGCGTEADMRAKLSEWVQKLEGDRLIAVTIFTTLLMNAVPTVKSAVPAKPRRGCPTAV